MASSFSGFSVARKKPSIGPLPTAICVTDVCLLACLVQPGQAWGRGSRNIPSRHSSGEQGIPRGYQVLHPGGAVQYCVHSPLHIQGHTSVTSFLEDASGACKMVRQVKVHAAESDNHLYLMSSIPGTHVVRENQLPKVLWSPHI